MRHTVVLPLRSCECAAHINRKARSKILHTSMYGYTCQRRDMCANAQRQVSSRQNTVDGHACWQTSAPVGNNFYPKPQTKHGSRSARARAYNPEPYRPRQRTQGLQCCPATHPGAFGSATTSGGKNRSTYQATS